jgi:hypothetical protein
VPTLIFDSRQYFIPDESVDELLKTYSIQASVDLKIPDARFMIVSAYPNGHIWLMPNKGKMVILKPSDERHEIISKQLGIKYQNEVWARESSRQKE